MRKILIVIVFLISITASFMAGVYVVPQKQPIIMASNSLDADILLTLINKHRSEIKTSPLISDDRLCEIAYRRIQEVKKNYSHDGFNKLIIGNPKYPFVLAENLGKGFGDVTNQGMVKGWLNSPPHRHTIEASWKYTCVATSDNYAVQIFSSFDNIDHNMIR